VYHTGGASSNRVLRQVVQLVERYQKAVEKLIKNKEARSINADDDEEKVSASSVIRLLYPPRDMHGNVFFDQAPQVSTSAAENHSTPQLPLVNEVEFKSDIDLALGFRQSTAYAVWEALRKLAPANTAAAAASVVTSSAEVKRISVCV